LVFFADLIVVDGVLVDGSEAISEVVTRLQHVVYALGGGGRRRSATGCRQVWARSAEILRAVAGP
jgi:hypothetical protein